MKKLHVHIDQINFARSLVCCKMLDFPTFEDLMNEIKKEMPENAVLAIVNFHEDTHTIDYYDNSKNEIS